MNKLLVILISIILASCSNELEFCQEHNEREIKWTNDIYNSSPQNELVPLSEMDGIIQYHGSDSWGWFNHTIRVIEKNKTKIIQVFDRRKNLQTKATDRLYKESIITEKQFNSIKSKMDNLMCKQVNLETGVGIDGNFYDLIIRADGKLQAFKWQSIFRTKNSEENKAIKYEVTKLVGELMKLSQFPNGTKQVILERIRSETDSIDVAIFAANQFNLRKTEVYYNKKKLKQNKDGVAEMRIHKQDTLELRKRINIKVELLNGEILEM